ncbi:hypothetical protein Cantr_01996 [Candida viswanathii]|uniref:Cytochrome P450 n=1 Tax=Candida viswanathii TaxID=5486 RepID=A0A367YL10_9ASCO|nr:hypothetical protein Cantr_01996 [Candida viswanathii]
MWSGSSTCVYFGYEYCYTKYLKHKHGAGEIENVIDDGFFGFRLPLLLMRASNEGRLIEFSIKRFESAPHPQNQTLVNRTLGVPLILTKDPMNIKAMLSTQFGDISLGLRLHQFEPLLGKGIFLSEWKHSRSMLRPQFAKDRVSHVLDLEPHFMLLQKHIDGHNGDYFDIQELYFRELVEHTRDPVALQDQVLNVLLTGRGTTALSLSFATFELARNDRMWKKLREEVILTMGQSSDETTVAGLKSCRYIKAILNETLRLYPSLPRNARFATRNTTLPRGGGPDGPERTNPRVFHLCYTLG